MGYYSIVAVAEEPVAIRTPMIMLDRGRNVFTAQTKDLEGLLKVLKGHGVAVQSTYRLDQFEPLNSQETLLLPTEREALALGHGKDGS